MAEYPISKGNANPQNLVNPVKNGQVTGEEAFLS
jgi:hypothetical protein